MDISLLLPEIVLVLFGIGVLVLGMFSPRSPLLPSLALFGVGIASGYISLYQSTGSTLGGMIVVDEFAMAFKFIMLFSTGMVALASMNYSRHFADFQAEYYALLLFACTGMMLLASAAEWITIYVALELTGVAIYSLSGMLKNRESSEAGLKFLLIGALSSAVLLYGIVFIFGLTGSTFLSDTGPMLMLGFAQNRIPVIVATVLLIAGFGFKIAAFPFQMWVPDVYQGAPTTVTAFLSVASKSAGIAVALRVFHTSFGQAPLSVDWITIFAILSAFSMVIGNVVAIQQTNIKRMMGYSSIAQAGFLLVGMAVLPQMGPGAVLFYMLSYAVTNLGAFFCIIALSEELGSDRIDDFAGAWQRSPWLAGAFAFCLLSLTGLPPTAGFFAKLFIFNAGLQQGLTWLVIIGVVNTAISAYYYIGIVKTMFLRTPASSTPISVPLPLGAAVSITTMFTFLLFVFAGPVLTVAIAAAGSIAP